MTIACVFNSYLLAKYNKQKRKKPADATSRANKALKSDQNELADQSTALDDIIFSDDSDSEEERVQMIFTLKQLIRKLHITQPAQHVMALIGKK